MSTKGLYFSEIVYQERYTSFLPSAVKSSHFILAKQKIQNTLRRSQFVLRFTFNIATHLNVSENRFSTFILHPLLFLGLY